MTFDDFKQKKKALFNKYKKDERGLATEYARTNSNVIIGNIVRDHIGTVKVDRISVYGLENPQCIYSGVEYTIKGEPFKSGSRRDVYQQNLTT